MDLPIEKRLEALPQITQRKLLSIFDSIPDVKDLLIDPAIMKPLQRFTGIKALRSHGIEKIYLLEGGQVPVTNMKRVFLLYSEYPKIRQVLQQIQAELQQHQGRSLSPHLILVPGTISHVAVEKLVEEEALYSLVTLHTLNFELIKLDQGLWSLEMPSAFRNLNVQGDISMLKPIAKALWSLQLVVGRPNLLWAQGGMAAKVVQLMERFPWPKDKIKSNQGQLGCLAIVSRDIDWPSMFLTPVTYTALVDQVIGSHCGNVKFASEAGASSAPDGIYLNSSTDQVYSHIKNLHFSSVFPYLSVKTKELQMEACKISKASSPSEMKAYVKERLAQSAETKKSLAQHIATCEYVVEQVGSSFESIQNAETMALSGRKGVMTQVEDLFGQNQLNLSQCLKLLGLLSVCGLSDDFEAVLTQFLLCHGHKHLSTVHSLGLMGLQVEEESSNSIVGRVAQAMKRKSSTIQEVDRKFKVLFPDGKEVPDKALPAQHMSYVFGGSYTPVVGRILEWFIKGEPVAQLEEALKVLPGPTMWRGSRGEYLPRPNLPVNPKTYIVFFIGGVTYAEVSAFQILEALTGVRILVASTSIVSKDTLVEACSNY
ncbi:vacuolar protein sorting-associated protein 33B [Neocloeon triangulifer]|uniref:vacuolar protein sorting-associated protein 33B n=1 Tax=Neocloeon triangulifer TaxID=2078957 RepID=UPI00286EC234|nr:vacuolar protein sorting-associated protein 33B [Neocloeon triangulifer]XP_059487241.1 vacuolar protein sorting-associated protein 33B [Neocloeon triangulifer]XP_059487242.1 vacuolar protein sorting-associated protein 33B [Neocloeon triangulifer]